VRRCSLTMALSRWPATTWVAPTAARGWQSPIFWLSAGGAWRARVAMASRWRLRSRLQVLQATTIIDVDEWTIGTGGVRGRSEAPSVDGFRVNGESGEEGALRSVLNRAKENGGNRARVRHVLRREERGGGWSQCTGLKAPSSERRRGPARGCVTSGVGREAQGGSSRE
jgi:hypothetical protein